MSCHISGGYQVLNDPRIARLFELLIDKNIPGIEPVFAPRLDSWVSYPAIEAELGTDADHAALLLEDLSRLGYLSRQFHDKVLFCPACNSQDLKLNTVCPKCRSANLARQRVLEHKNCGYIGTESEFTKSGGRACPKCRVELVLVGSDYVSRGLRHRCLACDAVIESPEENWTCRSCHRVFRKDEVREVVMYSYLLDQAQISKLRVERIPKARVREFLTREGYEIQESIQTTGRSGAEHRIDLLATKRSGPLEHRIVVGFSSAETVVDSEEVIKLYAKAYDVSAQDIIMVASPKLSDDGRQFASHYHIRVYSAEDLDRLYIKLPA
ncbi:MAG: restriction endonuclease [candidate division WOR-3 bacterium]|nr:restriction endonuclease [candidate division WOR-3 bacterium]